MADIYWSYSIANKPPNVSSALFQLRLCQLESFSLNEYCIVLYCTIKWVLVSAAIMRLVFQLISCILTFLMNFFGNISQLKVVLLKYGWFRLIVA